MNSNLKSILFWMTLLVVLGLIWQFSARIQSAGNDIPFSEFLSRLDKGEVAEVTFTGNEITGKWTTLSVDGTTTNFRTYAPSQFENLGNRLEVKGVTINARKETAGAWTAILLSWARHV